MDKVIIDIPDGRRFRLGCELQTIVPKKKNYGFEELYVKKYKVFKYDTGSQFTCMPAEDLGVDISEEEFITYSKNKLAIEGIGIDTNTRIKYYLIQVDKFIVAGIDLGSVPIYITFDKRY